MRTTAVFVVLALAGCTRAPPKAVTTDSSTPAPATAGATSSTVAGAATSDWRGQYDLDGDGTPDHIVDDFSGGAHCCYRLGATLSATGETVMLPFEMDGGYPGGLDLSKPERFTVRTPAGGLPEIVMEIVTYNGKQEPLDPAWTAKFGIRTHRVAICFPGGRPRIRDFVPGLAPCLVGATSTD